MYEGGLKVPYCDVWLQFIQAGSKSRDYEVALTMDLFPTICQAAGAKFDHEIDGQSIWLTLSNTGRLPIQGRDVHRDLFFHRREGGNRYGGLTINALRRGDWKLLQNSPFAPLELYNLKDDPQEQNDLAKENVKVFNELSAALRVQIQRGGAVPWQRPERKNAK